MTVQHEIVLPPFPRGFHLITDIILKQLPPLPEKGLLHLFLQHTSAGICINENYDPRVRKDMETLLNHLVPENFPYTHDDEGPDDMPAHVKNVLVGHSLTIPIVAHKLYLGTWQGIYFCEFRNRGGRRRLFITIYS